MRQNEFKEFGRIDLLVNNAAISHNGKPGRKLEDVISEGRATVASFDEVKAIWETNVFGAIALNQSMLPLIKESSAGRIVNVSSGVSSLNLKIQLTLTVLVLVGYAASKRLLMPSRLALLLI